MNTKTWVSVFLAGLMAGAVPVPAASETPGSSREAAHQWAEEGLLRVGVAGLDAAYVRRGASLAGYSKVRLAPLQVSFRRDWGRPTSLSAGSRIQPRDTERIRQELAALVQEEVARQLAEGGYIVVDEPGEDVLEVRAELTNLYIQAPKLTASASATKTYALSAGEMSLVADLRDSVTGDTVMRIYDHAEASETNYVHWITQSENRSEARRAAAAWAKTLCALLDQAKGVPSP